jgi:hypothetical protein
LAGETEVLGENLPQCHFVHHKPHMLPVRKPGPPWWEASVLTAELRHGLKAMLKLMHLIEFTVRNFILLSSVFDNTMIIKFAYFNFSS